jgi:hypothetical protein
VTGDGDTAMVYPFELAHLLQQIGVIGQE